ncbi:nuclear transport factor 2 family protein [Chlorogloeopsis sp. ULAP01]|uniref:nuclear transport factor 2 family protein n=1 Tax=Chlorogloeopsis sp. ULAP01 TaxID=3056483 RepID=UPI0025AABC44|nr:nuclear transport factor 2 family protein [Chlorogloeopsis sp. ULAP01]MDM9382743.1 nuclear transport factor 2 family protein [Chlorogloeopsis sp. ULAP01]
MKNNTPDSIAKLGTQAGRVAMKSAEILAIAQPVQEVEQLEERRYQAMLAKDITLLEHLLSEDLSYVHSTGFVDSKASYIAFVRSGGVQYQQIERENLVVRTYSDTAVVTGRILMTVVIKGEVRFIDNVFVNIWEKRNQGWQFVHWQSTPISR